MEKVHEETVISLEGVSESAEHEGELHNRLIKEGRDLPVFGSHESPDSLKNWANPDLIRAGQDFVRHNFFGFMFACFITIISTLHPRFIKATFQCGNYHDRRLCGPSSVRGFLRTLAWFQNEAQLDILSESNTAVEHVRKRHEQIFGAFDTTLPLPEVELSSSDAQLLAALHRDFQEIEISPVTTEHLADYQAFNPMTQFDMAGALFSFYGTLSLFPKSFGVRTKSVEEQKELAGFVHILAIVGNLFGIHDRFNPALNLEDSISQHKLLHDFTFAAFQLFDPYGMTIASTLFATATKYIPFIRMNVLFYYVIHDVFQLEGKAVLGILSRTDRFMYKILKSTFNAIYGCWLIRVLVNGLARVLIPRILQMYMRFWGNSVLSNV